MLEVPKSKKKKTIHFWPRKLTVSECVEHTVIYKKLFINYCLCQVTGALL